MKLVIVETDGEAEITTSNIEKTVVVASPEVAAAQVEEQVAQIQESVQTLNEGSRFYSPLVRSIASEEGVSLNELEQISGTGKEGRVTKSDILAYLKNKMTPAASSAVAKDEIKETPTAKPKLILQYSLAATKK